MDKNDPKIKEVGLKDDQNKSDDVKKNPSIRERVEDFYGIYSLLVCKEMPLGPLP